MKELEVLRRLLVDAVKEAQRVHQQDGEGERGGGEEGEGGGEWSKVVPSGQSVNSPGGGHYITAARFDQTKEK